MALWVLQISVMVLPILLGSCQGKRDTLLYCSACKAVVDELNYAVSQVDPKKTINIGSFRLDPDGTMKDKKVPLARSETHLSELLEGVCDHMSDYALHVNPDTQQKSYRRFAPRSSEVTGDFPNFKDFQFDGPEASNALKFACETIVEELEDEIISVFSRDTPPSVDHLCATVSDYCKDSAHQNEEL
ncbi:protein canopy-1 [Thalassophryne amazonica]|uniref:protein canopy-1 n=1 Tax=Thalassophryne amazonica TaxID=390379 RepID=UPI001471BF99|nr:protein canopy-1 [Thalassophryne amazonica]